MTQLSKSNGWVIGPASRCDSPDCQEQALVYVGRPNRGESKVLGHAACKEHIFDALVVTAQQLDWVGYKGELAIIFADLAKVVD